jgi:hypothetical protein
MQQRAMRSAAGLRTTPWFPATAESVCPAFLRLPPPVIIIGMHRSGTSMVGGMLSLLGTYLGSNLRLPRGARAQDPLYSSGYAEAGEFYRLNEQLLARAGAAWNRVEPFLERRRSPQYETDSVETLRRSTWGELRSLYLRGLAPASTAVWGWKDPRTSLTLPYWLQLFPEARILHVMRDPQQVADSVHRRAQEWEAQAGGAPTPGLMHDLRHPRRALRRLLRRPQPLDPCLDRDYCVTLANRYVGECLPYRALGEQYHEVHYNELMADPASCARRLARFVGCCPSPEQYAAAAALPRS